MIFCSFVAYNHDDHRREWSERCLATLSKQLETDDVLLKAETLGRSWEDCLACKVRLACSALEFADDFVCLAEPSNEGNKVKISALLRRLLRETRRVQG